MEMSVISPSLRAYLSDTFSTVLTWASESAKVLNKTELIEWLGSVPICSTFRVNTLKTTSADAVSIIKEKALRKWEASNANNPPEIYVHPIIPDCVVINRLDVSELDLHLRKDEVIVDVWCGVAALRGADIYTGGVMKVTPLARKGDVVSVYADMSGKCLRGWKADYTGEKLFVGNGILRVNRRDVFCSADVCSKVAVEMTNPCSGLMLLPLSPDVGMFQNLPSMVCAHALDTQPGDSILDMCASPGNKTTHIAALLNDKGRIVAIDRNERKIRTLREQCATLSVTCVMSYAYDSTVLCAEDGATRDIEEGPPFVPETFDKILLDAPCSGLGLRPMLKSKLQCENFINSIQSVQRRLLLTAVSLLKPGGTLVYSTCSILCEENERLVHFALTEIPCLMLVPAEPRLGAVGLPNCGLTEEQRNCIQRFGPNGNEDCIGFFIAKFKKI